MSDVKPGPRYCKRCERMEVRYNLGWYGAEFGQRSTKCPYTPDGEFIDGSRVIPLPESDDTV